MMKKTVTKTIVLFLCIFVTMGIMIGCSSETDDNDYKKEENNSSSFLKDILEGETVSSDSEVIDFSDFLVERCVREKLGKDWDEDITYGDVQEIEELDICNTYDPTFAINNDNKMGYSGYIDLADLRYFKNLKVLRVSANVTEDSIVNVDAIANCTKLEELILPCTTSYQYETINLAGYKYWKNIFAKLPKLEKVDLGIYVDDNMKEIMLSETSNKEIEFDKGSRTYDYGEIDYYFYKMGSGYSPRCSWFEADGSNYVEEWDYGYKSISDITSKNLLARNKEGWMFPAIVADDESSLKKQLSDIDEDIEDLVVVIGNFEFDFKLLEHFNNLVTLTIINNDFNRNVEEKYDKETGMWNLYYLGWLGVVPKNGDVLSKFDNLQVLNLSGFIGDLSFVGECDKLREFSMVNCVVDNTAFIGKLKSLKELIIGVFDNRNIEYTENFYKEVNEELMKLTGLKYLKDQNPNHSGEEYKDINEMESLETLWLDRSGEYHNTVYNILQSCTIKNLAIGWFSTIFDGKFDKMESLESVYLGFHDTKVEKESIYSLVELETIKSIALGQISMDDGYFEDIYTEELAERVVKNENMSAFLMPILKDYIDEIRCSIDKDFIKILYEAGVKESIYSHYYLYNENLTIDKFLEWE